MAASTTASSSSVVPPKGKASSPEGEMTTTFEVSLTIELVSVPLLHPLLLPNLNESTAARKRAELSFRGLLAVLQFEFELSCGGREA